MVVCLVYGLRSSRDARVRYIGQTTKAIDRRVAKHRENARLNVRTHLYNWMRSEIEAGHAIEAIVLDSNAVWNETERALIAQHTDLVNQTAGGDGTLGWTPSVEQRARMRAAHLGVPIRMTDREKKRITDQIVAYGRSAEGRAFRSARQMGKKLSIETIAKRTTARRANGGYIATESSRAKQAAAATAQWAKRKGLAHVEN